jgi:hypothetical protein
MDQAAWLRFSLARSRLAASADGLRLAPSPAQQVQAVRSFCDAAEQPAKCRHNADQSSSFVHNREPQSPRQSSSSAIVSAKPHQPQRASTLNLRIIRPIPFSYRALCLVRLGGCLKSPSVAPGPTGPRDSSFNRLASSGYLTAVLARQRNWCAMPRRRCSSTIRAALAGKRRR